MGKLRLTISTEEVKNPDKQLKYLQEELDKVKSSVSSDDSPHKHRVFFITCAKILNSMRIAMNNKIEARWE